MRMHSQESRSANNMVHIEHLVLSKLWTETVHTHVYQQSSQLATMVPGGLHTESRSSSVQTSCKSNSLDYIRGKKKSKVCLGMGLKSQSWYSLTSSVRSGFLTTSCSSSYPRFLFLCEDTDRREAAIRICMSHTRCITRC